MENNVKMKNSFKIVCIMMAFFLYFGGSAEAASQLQIKKPTYVYQSTTFQSKLIGNIQPQKVTIIKSKGDWKQVKYKENNKSKQGWIAPSGINKTFSKSFTVYNRPMIVDSKATKLAKGKYKVIGETLTNWLVIERKGKVYYTPASPLKVTLAADTDSYEEDLETINGTVKKGTYQVVSESKDRWIQIDVSGSKAWIDIKKAVKSNEEDTFERAFEIIVKNFEGGCVNHPNDLGGSTNFGITQKVYDEFLGEEGYDVCLITDEEVRTIYYEVYYTNRFVNANRMTSNLATVMLDTAINFGKGNADAIFQRAFRIDQKGATNWGQLTEYSFNMLSVSKENELARRILVERTRSRYNIIAKDPSQKVFLKGWLSRDEALKKILKL